MRFKFKIINLTVFVVGFTFLISMQANSQDFKNNFYKANRLYENGQYDQAILEYNKVLSKGFESSGVYYNLGNSHFKKGQLGKAILNYERTERIIPRDRDLESNYTYAKSLIKGPRIKSDKFWAAKVMDSFFNQFNLNEITMLLSIVFGLLAIIVSIGFLFKLSKIKPIIGISILAIFFVTGFVYLNSKVALLDKEGIVMRERIEARFEPSDKATSHFTLYEGTKVYIITSKDNWHKIKRIDGKIGWIKKPHLELIIKGDTLHNSLLSKGL